MDLSGRRESSNVEDRRRMSGGAKAGLGLGGTLLVGIIVLLMGGNPIDVLKNSNMTSQTATESSYTPSAEEEALAKFSKQILAGTEDVWAAEFKKMGKKYVPPKLVLFHGSVQ